MNTYKLSNISVNDFRNFLSSVGCQKTKTEGGHERWAKTGLTRPIISFFRPTFRLSQNSL